MDGKEYRSKIEEMVSKLLVFVRRNNVLSEDREAVRDIGLQASLLGGVPAMREVGAEIRTLYEEGALGELGGEDDFHPAEIDAAWDGVGGWRW